MSSIGAHGTGYLSPNEFERRAGTQRPMGAEGHREQTNLEPFRIGRPGIHNHPRGDPQHRSPRESSFHRLSFTPVPVPTALNRAPG